MNDHGLMRRLRAARPVAAETGHHDGLFAQIVATPGDPRLVDAPHGRSFRLLGRRRILAGGTLGLAAVAAALAVAVSGSTAPPAFAITRNGDGSVLVTINQNSALPQANAKLAAMGIHEQIAIEMAPGAAAVSGPVDCVPQGDVSGPAVKAIVGTTGTETIPSGNSGAGTWHMAGCHLYSTTTTGGNPLYGESSGAWGDTGNSGAR